MQLQDSVKNFNHEAKLLCEAHPENVLQLLHFGVKSYRKSRMLCIQCLIDSQNDRDNLNNLVNIDQFLIDPKNSIQKIISTNKGDCLKNIQQILYDIDVSLKSYEELIKIQLIKIKEIIQYLRMQYDQMEVSFYGDLNLNEVVEQIQHLKQLDSYQGTHELTNLENKLNFIGQHIILAQNNQYQKFKNNQLEIFENLKDNLFKLQDQSELLLKQSKNLIIQITDTHIELNEIKDFPLIHLNISEGKNIEYKLIYQGTRDGLNSQAYWSKCNLQSNLLTIMTSKNGNKFGGYSPCQINHQLNGFVKDPTMKSFIFQYNKKEIYKLKNKEYAVYCQLNNGPSYGFGGDIFISEDFQNGHTNYLGKTYDISGYNIIDTANHIFGAKSSQLSECKVYKIVVKT